jgi:glycosyltransferase involved in cell wall biosynthesis
MIKNMEYMALAKPIVAFDLPEHRVTIQDGALYAKPNDELDFARKISILMENQELRNKMGRINRSRIEEDLNWTHQAKHLISAYAKL